MGVGISNRGHFLPSFWSSPTSERLDILVQTDSAHTIYAATTCSNLPWKPIPLSTKKKKKKPGSQSAISLI